MLCYITIYIYIVLFHYQSIIHQVRHLSIRSCSVLVFCSFCLSITRCDRSSMTKMPRGFYLRAACKMLSRSLYDSNLTTTVFGWPEEFDAPVLCARSMRIWFACSSRCCGERFPDYCLCVGPSFSRDFRHLVDPQVVHACLIFGVVDAVFHLALCVGYPFDVLDGVGQTVALGTNGGLHLVDFFLRML